MDAIPEFWSVDDKRMVEAIADVMFNRENEKEYFCQTVLDKKEIYVLAGAGVASIWQAAREILEGGTGHIEGLKPVAVLMAVKVIKKQRAAETDVYVAEGVDQVTGPPWDRYYPYLTNKVHLEYAIAGHELYLYGSSTARTIESTGNNAMLTTLVLNGTTSYLRRQVLKAIQWPEQMDYEQAENEADVTLPIKVDLHRMRPRHMVGSVKLYQL